MIPLGLGLYSVRHELEKDLTGTLAAIREMGYDGVEFFGDFTRSAEEIKKALDETGLVCCGWHTPLDRLMPDKLQETIAYHKTIGNRYVVVPGFPKEYTATIKDWQRAAETMNGIAEALAKVDMKTGYHNHHVEFETLEGQKPWDAFWTMADPRLIMQLDLGNAAKGGGDVVEVSKRYPNRGETLHIKPYSKVKEFATMIGDEDDDIPWDEYFAEMEKQGKTKWYIVEYECETLYEPMEGVRKAIDAMHKMGK